MARKVPRARKRGRTRTRTITRTRTRTVARRPSRRRSSFGGGWLPPADDMKDMAGAYAYGHFEKAARDDDKHWLRKVPKPIDALGFTGNVGAIAWIIAKVTRNPIARHFAKGTLDVAAYKLARRGKMYDKATDGMDLGDIGDDDDGYADMQGLDAGIAGDEYEED